MSKRLPMCYTTHDIHSHIPKEEIVKKFSVILLTMIVVSLLLSACVSSFVAQDPVTFFDGQVMVQRVRVHGESDHVTFVFTKAGQYDLAFYKIEGQSGGINLVPNFSVTVSDTPHFETVYKYSIMTQRVSVTLNGVTESKILP